MGRNNYLLNELGIAIFYPNVRGSTGYGKRFVSLDNGPFKREDSVKDIGAFLDRLTADPALDAGRMAVTGGSYGGYMCYASAIAYADPLQGRACATSPSPISSPSSRTRKAIAATCAASNMATSATPRSAPSCSRSRRCAASREINAPLFVVQGANDPRVPKSEADQIVKAIRGRGGTGLVSGRRE